MASAGDGSARGVSGAARGCLTSATPTKPRRCRSPNMTRDLTVAIGRARRDYVLGPPALIIHGPVPSSPGQRAAPRSSARAVETVARQWGSDDEGRPAARACVTLQRRVEVEARP